MGWRVLLEILSIVLVSCTGARPPAPVPSPGAIAAVRAPRTPDTSLTLTPACSTALEHVQTYTVPGQQQTIQQHVEAYMTTLPKAGPGVWRPSDHTAQGYCAVLYAAERDAEDRNADPVLLAWEYRPATGQVSTTDDATKRISGW